MKKKNKRASNASSLEFDSARSFPEETNKPSTHTYGQGIPAAGGRW